MLVPAWKWGSSVLIQRLVPLLLPCPGIYCFWACARYGTAARYRAMLGDLGILIPEALADAPDSNRMGHAGSIPRVLALGR